MTLFIVGAYRYQNGRTPCAYPDTYAKGTPAPNRNIAVWRRKLQAAYAHASYAEAKRALLRLGRELTIVNASAARSLEEGLEETLSLHRLGVFPKLGTSFKTTNPIESVMARVATNIQRVDRWRTSDEKLRWCASACPRAPVPSRERP